MAEREPTPIAPARSLAGATTEAPLRETLASKFRRPAGPASAPAGAPAARPDDGPRLVRQAKLRLVQIEPWSVMKAAFLLSVAVGIVTVVAVGIVWSVLGAAGLWDSVNSIVRDSVGTNSGTPFEIQKYLGTSRILGFTMIVAVADVVLITAIATLAAFLYNLAATLVGGVEVTFAEDK